MKKAVKSKRVLSFILFFMLSISLTLTGCYNYREINKITFVTSVIFDRDQYNNVILYLDCVTPYRNANESSDKGKRVVFGGKGKTALEAIRDINVQSSNDLNFTQVRSYIFTEDAAIHGIDRYLDLIENNQEFGYKTYMFVYFGDVKSLIKVENNDEEYLGLYLDSLIEMNKKNGKVIYNNVSDYLTSSVGIPNVAVMSAIELKSDVVEEKVLLNGGVVMKDNHMVARLEERDTLNYNLLTRRIREGSFQVSNLNEADKFITLDILENERNTEIRIEDDRIKLDEVVKVRTSIGEIQGELDINYSVLEAMNREEEVKLKKSLESFFNDYKDNGIDILRVERLVKERYPKYYVEDILSKTDINVSVDIIIDGSSIIKDSR